MYRRKLLLLSVTCLTLLLLLLSACGGSKGWDGGDFAGQPVYDLSNKRFSTDATEALKACGIDDKGIESLAKTLLPDVKEVSGSLSGITITYTDVSSNKDIADISLEKLRSDTYKVTCTPK